jgi:hypothetical protein
MNKLEPLPEIAELVLELMPNATREEQLEATRNLRAYLAAVYRIFVRLESEGNLGLIHDKSRERDRVENNYKNRV